MGGEILTSAEVLQKWAARHGHGIYASQRRGRVSWLAGAGRMFQFINKGELRIDSHSLFALRPAMRELKEFWDTAKRQEKQERRA